MQYEVGSSDDVVFTVGGGGREIFEFVFDAAMLRRFLEVGTTALVEMADQEPGV